jgi:hypothetical protein
MDRFERLPPIFRDERYLHCISLARLCKNDGREGKDEKYGSRLELDGALSGIGINRAIVHKHIKLDRKIRQGFSNDAEIEAIERPVRSGIDVSGGEIYVAGFFYGSGTLFLQDRYTCKRCPPILEKYGIRSINIPSPDCWIAKSPEQAMEEAQEFLGDAYRKRKEACIGEYNIGLIEDELYDLKRSILLH